jgi:hypothetical protein
MEVMLDIETMGRTPGCAVISIAAIAFSFEEPLIQFEDLLHKSIGRTFYRNITLQSNELANLHLDANTVDWWLTCTSHEAKLALQTPEPISLVEALNQLALFIDSLSPFGQTQVWAKDPSFDCNILRAANEAARGSTYPLGWTHRDENSVRTISRLAKTMYPDLELNPDGLEGDEHNPLHDAYNQMVQTVRAYQALMYRRYEGITS